MLFCPFFLHTCVSLDQLMPRLDATRNINIHYWSGWMDWIVEVKKKAVISTYASNEQHKFQHKKLHYYGRYVESKPYDKKNVLYLVIHTYIPCRQLWRFSKVDFVWRHLGFTILETFGPGTAWPRSMATFVWAIYPFRMPMNWRIPWRSESL